MSVLLPSHTELICSVLLLGFSHTARRRASATCVSAICTRQNMCSLFAANMSTILFSYALHRRGQWQEPAQTCWEFCNLLGGGEKRCWNKFDCVVYTPTPSPRRARNTRNVHISNTVFLSLPELDAANRAQHTICAVSTHTPQKTQEVRHRIPRISSAIRCEFELKDIRKMERSYLFLIRNANK